MKVIDIFTSRMQSELRVVASRFTEIKNVDANEDYEDYDNNKKNEELKALTEFFVNLTLLDIISLKMQSY